MIDMLTIEGDGYTIDVIARVTLDDDYDDTRRERPSVRALGKCGEITAAIEEAM